MVNRQVPSPSSEIRAIDKPKNKTPSSMDLVLGMATATLVVSSLRRSMEVVVARDTCIDPGSNASRFSGMREIVRANTRVTARIITSRSSWRSQRSRFAIPNHREGRHSIRGRPSSPVQNFRHSSLLILFDVHHQSNNGMTFIVSGTLIRATKKRWPSRTAQRAFSRVRSGHFNVLSPRFGPDGAQLLRFLVLAPYKVKR